MIHVLWKMWNKLKPLNTVAVIKQGVNFDRKLGKSIVTEMMCSITKILPILGFFVVLVVLCGSVPVNEKQGDLKGVQNGRTIMKEGMDMMKDMFDFGSITWVPLGSLIFGNRDDIAFAKWPSNKDKN